jgi:hypothetical protein
MPPLPKKPNIPLKDDSILFTPVIAETFGLEHQSFGFFQ